MGTSKLWKGKKLWMNDKENKLNGIRRWRRFAAKNDGRENWCHILVKTSRITQAGMSILERSIFKVPLPGEWEDNPDKLLLELAGVYSTDNRREVIDRRDAQSAKNSM